MKAFKIILNSLLFIVLTILTQIGGLVYLLSLITHRYIDSKITKISLRRAAKMFTFLVFYLLFTFALVPAIAPVFGRVRLPITESHHLKPLTLMTCLLNRNYVRPELKSAVLEIADQLHASYPGTGVNYLDANFPFINKFPLLPHLSHNDGKKLDLSFSYIDKRTNRQTNSCPSFIGYGICEEPLAGEKNTAEFCSEQGHWQYSILKAIVPQGSKKDFLFDAQRTRTLIELCGNNASIAKIFIEPHLKTRLGLSNPKIRFHGCQAVRHDDHIHIQMN
jgi:hypothetical protein